MQLPLKLCDWWEIQTFTSLMSDAAFLIALGTSLRLCWTLRDPKEPASSTKHLMALLLGSLVGWVLGVMWVPYTAVDAHIYQQIGATVTAFASGFLFSKVDKMIDALLFRDIDKGISSPAILRIISFFMAGLLTCAATVVANRLEWVNDAALCKPGAFGTKETQNRAPDELACKRARLSMPSK